MLLALLACPEPPDLDYSTDGDESVVLESEPPDSEGLPDPCAYAAGEQVGTVSAPELTEISGMAFAKERTWVHNDGNDDGKLYALGDEGASEGTAWIEDYLLIDPEDMAKFDGDLYLGDIGDNGENREFVRVFRFPPPDPDFPVGALESFHVTYPDGAHDAEAMVVDSDGSLYILSKSASGETGIYKLAAPLADGELELAGQITLGTTVLPGSTGATSADADETRIVLRTYTHLFLWQRRGRTLPEALQSPPSCILDIQSEPQGEAVALTPRGILTVSEGESQPIWFYAYEG